MKRLGTEPCYGIDQTEQMCWLNCAFCLHMRKKNLSSGIGSYTIKALINTDVQADLRISC